MTGRFHITESDSWKRLPLLGGLVHIGHDSASDSQKQDATVGFEGTERVNFDQDFREAVTELLDEGTRQITIDVREVEEFEPSSLGVLVGLHSMARKRKATVHLLLVEGSPLCDALRSLKIDRVLSWEAVEPRLFPVQWPSHG